MNIIFLRGSVPPKNENPEKLIYDRIENCEDQWTQLFHELTQRFNAKAEILYDKGNRVFEVDESFTEKWVDLKSYVPDFEPDLIVCRGGFPYYDDFIKKFPQAKKVYYGAGKRFYPITDITDYDLFLCDSESQRETISTTHGKKAELFIKPAATMFRPECVEKIYDVCFMANATQQSIKRHKMFIKQFAGSSYKILSLGNTDDALIKMAKDRGVDITWDGWSLRRLLPAKISQCRVGVCCSTNYDSCPRVIPEYLACGLPVVATKNINFWHDKYITSDSGVLVNESNLVVGVDKLLNTGTDASRHYRTQLCMEKATDHLERLIRENCF